MKTTKNPSKLTDGELDAALDAYRLLGESEQGRAMSASAWGELDTYAGRLNGEKMRRLEARVF